MDPRAFLACCIMLATMLVVSTISLTPPPQPVPAIKLNDTPDASVPPPPEPAGDCGSWYDDEECEV